jgi:hypothetical protein
MAGHPTADADKFMGDWELGVDTPQGAMTLALKDQAGKVAATVTSNFQGMDIPTEITLIPDGEKWKANFNFASGQFLVDGTAVKK